MKKISKSPQKTRSYWKRKADALFALKVRSRGMCERCGKGRPAQLQCAHIITRSNLHLRFNLQNALCLCAGCHFYWHHEPLECMGWFKAVFSDRAAYLLKEKNVIEHNIDYQKIIDNFKSNV